MYLPKRAGLLQIGRVPVTGSSVKLRSECPFYMTVKLEWFYWSRKKLFLYAFSVINKCLKNYVIITLGLFIRVCCNMTRGNDFKLRRVGMIRCFNSEGGETMGHIAQRSGGCSVAGNI